MSASQGFFRKRRDIFRYYLDSSPVMMDSGIIGVLPWSNARLKEVGLGLSLTSCVPEDTGDHSCCKAYVESLFRLSCLSKNNKHQQAEIVSLLLQVHQKDQTNDEHVRAVLPVLAVGLSSRGKDESSSTISELDFEWNYFSQSTETERLLIPLIAKAITGASPKLKRLRLTAWTSSAMLTLLDALLEGEKLRVSAIELHDCPSITVEHIRKLNQLLARPGGLVKAFKLDNCPWESDDHGLDDLVTLARSLKCFIFDKRNPSDVIYAVAVSRALFAATNQLIELELSSVGLIPSEALALALTNPHCRLESLAIKFGPYKNDEVNVMICNILDAIKNHPTTLRNLELWKTMDDVTINALAQCLLLPNTRLNQLKFAKSPKPYRASEDLDILSRFKRAVRLSVLKDLEFPRVFPICPFVETFQKGWFHVLVALTSVHHLASHRSCCRPSTSSGAFSTFPVMEFIVGIAKTLGWELEKLC